MISDLKDASSDVPPLMETERLLLRRYGLGDGGHYFAMLRDNRERLKEHVDEVSTIRNIIRAEWQMYKCITDWMAHRKFIFGVWKKDSSSLVGEMGLYPVKWDVPLFEMGWFLDGKYEGRGYASEAVEACLAFLFVNLKAHKVQVRVRESNKKSIDLAVRCGFVREGLLRDHARVREGFVGLLLFGMLAGEYASQTPKEKVR